MHIRRVYALSTKEFDGLVGTELFARLVSRKYMLIFPSSISYCEQSDLEESARTLVEMNATGPWYSYRNTYYFSNDEDSCFFEKDVLKYDNKEEEYGYPQKGI